MRLARGRRDVLLSAWLTAATGHEVNVGRLYGEPRNWKANWPVDIANETDRIAAEQHRQQHVDRIGNLTLITGSFNGSLSDSAWDVKRAAMVEQSKLQLNSRRLVAGAVRGRRSQTRRT
ncbi:HNH endonuclease family protein [Nocardia vaccinii]|uniref:HNH endonuclease family protein n=1 Tax=Nocardia vaccinii TaxID=1822 RepID=UPI00082AB31E|nr:HNH endonuclease family protein [Nocardia vaccinii]